MEEAQRQRSSWSDLRPSSIEVPPETPLARQRTNSLMETGDAAGPVKGRERRLSIPGVANIATQVALAQKVTGMWANITEVARKRELEAQNRRAEEAAHEDMVQQLKIRYSRSHSHTGGMVIIGDRRGSSKSSASANHDFRSPSRGRLRKVTPAKDDNGDDDEVELKVGDHFGYDPSEEGSSEDAPAIAEVVQADAMETGEEAKAEGASTSGTTINSPEVTSLTDCLLLAISSSSFDEVLKAHPQLAGLMMQAKVAEAAEAASFKRRDAANGGAPGGAPAMSGAMSGGMAVNPLVESQLVHLQRSLDEVTGRIGSLEMEINRCRAAQERQESTEKANTERIMLKLHEISSKAGGSQGPGMPSGLNQMMSSAGFGQQGGGPRRRSLTNDNIGTM